MIPALPAGMSRDVTADPPGGAVYSAFEISREETIIYDTRNTAAWIQSNVQHALDEMR
ncbi:hypothetical protein [Haloarchaeobius sp. HME9146]|uniref:DUF7331 family protein n=1 Tax=Haloarchaeobius sp. HME9146 TaxID=2978732 RepID=UPI0021C13DB4|nr:hypothetical protein [Haloarchaeobius sp. HME9146]MCT9095615.1 hypothetical protein [Haloarchaeobius sp. HME9146]